ncbi:hypothetical protein GY45DRAFT_239294 [Cubamyces sp. BRFM 1775]|nr:hypothetical protein GY45DRAFT_239294 [Cubamyces sp. BRFM 1775]
MWCDVGFSPAYPSGTQYYFTHDADLTLLVLSIRLDHAVVDVEDGSEAVDDDEDDTEDHMVSERLSLLIPIATLLPFYSDPAHSSSADFGMAHQAPPSPSSKPLERNRTIPWEEWGTHGTRMLFISRTASMESDFYAPPSALGNWVSSARYDPFQEAYVVDVYEAHPLVNVTLPSSGDSQSGVKSERHAGDTAPVDDSSESIIGDYVDSKAGRSHIRTTYPYRSTTRILKPHEWEDQRHLEGNARDILLTHDGLVRMMIKVCLQSIECSYSPATILRTGLTLPTPRFRD